MANFKAYSRYYNGIVATNRTGKNFLVLRQPIDLPQDPEDTFVTVTSDLVNRPDLISTKAYSTPDYWWVICEYNQIYDPLFQLKINSVLRIPTLDRVLAAIEALEVT
jgi:hypothetical protein